MRLLSSQTKEWRTRRLTSSKRCQKKLKGEKLCSLSESANTTVTYILTIMTCKVKACVYVHVCVCVGARLQEELSAVVEGVKGWWGGCEGVAVWINGTEENTLPVNMYNLCGSSVHDNQEL